MREDWGSYPGLDRPKSLKYHCQMVDNTCEQRMSHNKLKYLSLPDFQASKSKTCSLSLAVEHSTGRKEKANKLPKNPIKFKYLYIYFNNTRSNEAATYTLFSVITWLNTVMIMPFMSGGSTKWNEIGIFHLKQTMIWKLLIADSFNIYNNLHCICHISLNCENCDDGEGTC